MSSEERVSNLSKRELADHGRTAIIAAISGIPVVGGSLSSLLSDYLPDRKAKRVLEFIADLSVRIRSVETRIDPAYVQSEEFTHLFESVFLRVLREYRRERLDALKAFLINACTNQSINSDAKEYFLQLIDRMEVIHMLILSLFWSPSDFAARHRIVAPAYVATGSLAQTIATYLRPMGFEQYLWESAVRDLDQIGLLGRVSSALRTAMTPQGATELTGRLTELGRRFCEFVIL